MEATAIIKQMSLRFLGFAVDRKSIQLPPPKAEKSRGEIYFGDVLFSSRRRGPIYLKRSDLQKHMCIVGTTGTGKTTFSHNLARQLIEKKIPFWIIDWKRAYRNLIQDPSHKDLIVFTVGRDVSSFEWNPLRPPPKTDPQSWWGIISDVLERSHVSGQGVADIFLEHLERMQGDYESEAVTFKEIKASIERVRYPGRKGLWQQSCLRILRTFSYGQGPLKMFNSPNPIRLEKLLKRHVVFELDMSLPKNLRTFFMEVIIRWIHLYRLGQGESGSLRHVLILEEIHNLVAGRNDNDNSLESVFRELRSFGQGAIAITQHPSLLPIWLLGNVHTLVSFGLTHQADIDAARRSFFLNRDDEDCFDRLKIGQGIAKIMGRTEAFHIQFPKVEYEIGKISDSEVTKHSEKSMDKIRDR
jgi:DNA polymerase III delta prime subunit